jgi:hypothetical protein
LRFNLRDIVPPTKIYNGLSYGGWAATWCNWLFSDQLQVGSVFFLRGNVDKEPGVVMTGKNGLNVYNDTAIFFPIICTFSSKLFNPNVRNEMQRRKDSTEPERDPTLLKLKINDTEVPNLHDYYAESLEFVLEINRISPLLRYINPPVRIGRSEAVTAGYWILLKPLPVGTYSIKFQGRHRDGYVTSGHYCIKIIKRPS